MQREDGDGDPQTELVVCPAANASTEKGSSAEAAASWLSIAQALSKPALSTSPNQSARSWAPGASVVLTWGISIPTGIEACTVNGTVRREHKSRITGHPWPVNGEPTAVGLTAGANRRRSRRSAEREPVS